MMYFFLIAYSWANCPETITPKAFQSLLESSRRAISEKRFQHFKAERKNVLSLLPCVRKQLTERQVAMFHQIQSIQAFMDRDLDKMGASVRAAVHADPKLQFPLDGFPSDHIMLQYISFAQSQKSAPQRKLSKPIKGKIAIDGQLTLKVPNDRPYIFQHLNKGNKVEFATVVSSGQRPEYKSWGGKKPIRLRLQPKFTIAAGTFALASVGTAFWSYQTKSKFWNPKTPKNELKSLQTKTNILSGTTITLGCISTGLLTTAIITGAW